MRTRRESSDLRTLVALGVHLFDNMDLQELARTARELNCWEFLFMASPHGALNGAGSAVDPLAVFWKSRAAIRALNPGTGRGKLIRCTRLFRNCAP